MKNLLKKHIFLLVAILFLCIAVFCGISTETFSGDLLSPTASTNWGMVTLVAIFGAGGMYSFFKYINIFISSK